MSAFIGTIIFTLCVLLFFICLLFYASLLNLIKDVIEKEKLKAEAPSFNFWSCIFLSHFLIVTIIEVGKILINNFN